MTNPNKNNSKEKKQKKKKKKKKPCLNANGQYDVAGLNTKQD